MIWNIGKEVQASSRCGLRPSLLTSPLTSGPQLWSPIIVKGKALPFFPRLSCASCWFSRRPWVTEELYVFSQGRAERSPAAREAGEWPWWCPRAHCCPSCASPPGPSRWRVKLTWELHSVCVECSNLLRHFCWSFIVNQSFVWTP